MSRTDPQPRTDQRRRSKRTARRVSVVLAATALVVPTAAVAAPPPASAPAQPGTATRPAPAVPKINWGSCGTDPKLAAFQCAQVEVPTDYDHPRGPTTTIALTRLPASDPARRIGTLFTNPGGPGGPGVDFVQGSARTAYTPEVRARFDILGFDPRGVGQSDPATCFPTEKEELAAYADVPFFPINRSEEKLVTLTNAKLAANCLSTSPDRFAHFSTANVARDMDLLRQAVGDDKLSYAGYSYGTYLGATYAKLFPDNVRALMLDGTLLPSWYSGSDGDSRPIGVRLRQGEGGSETLAQFKKLCENAGPSRCALAKLGDPATVVEELLQRLKTHPVELTMPDGSTVKVTYQAAVMTIFFSLYSPSTWTDLATQLAQLSVAADQKTAARRTVKVASGNLHWQDWNRRKDEYTSIGSSLQICVEARQSGRPLAYPQYAAAADRRAPHFGLARAWVGQLCEFLPIRDHDAFRGPWNLKVKPPVLVYGTRFDPATPYQATRPYADLYPDARVVTLNGWGHTTIGQSKCADATTTAYLVDLKAPADGSTCEPDRQPFDPAAREKAGSRPELPIQRWNMLNS